MSAFNSIISSDALAIKPAYSYTEHGCDWGLFAKTKIFHEIPSMGSLVYQKLSPCPPFSSSIPKRTSELAIKISEVWYQMNGNRVAPNSIVILKPDKLDEKITFSKMSFKELTFFCGLLIDKLKPTYLQMPAEGEWEVLAP